MLTTRQANTNEFMDVRAFYHELIDEMKSSTFRPGWEKGVYPSDDFLQAAINSGQLFVGLWDGKIASAMVMNHENNEGYNKVNWSHSFLPNEVIIIHALGILPSFQGRGIAKAMCHYAFKWAKDNNMKAIRLDVLGTNEPAQNLYVAMGFRYVDTIKMFYEDTGLTDYLLYEWFAD